jgi:CheY-like chemotaxis protein
VRSAGEGLGSEFAIRLPAARGEATEAVNEATASPASPGATVHLRILVVDDNQDAATMLALGLVKVGHSVRVFHDAPSALAEVEGFAPDVAVLDIGLPEMDGYELAERLRRAPGLERLHLVALTGYGQEGDRLRSAAAGFDVHLVKPVTWTRVNAVLAGFAAERR